jgi:hypothetical protein
MILYIIGDVDLQANIGTTGTPDVTEFVAFTTAVNVEREMCTEEDKRFRMP